jgi:hypothetical protein
MKLLLPILFVSLSFAVAQAESPIKKVEQGVSDAAQTTESTVKKAARKTGDAVETGVKATEKAAKKTGNAVKEGVGDATRATEKAANKTAKGTKKAADDVADSELFKKIEKELKKPFTPEQKAKYAEAWQSAQDKARSAEQEFADKVSEITGMGKKKSKQIVTEHGL